MGGRKLEKDRRVGKKRGDRKGREVQRCSLCFIYDLYMSDSPLQGTGGKKGDLQTRASPKLPYVRKDTNS